MSELAAALAGAEPAGGGGGGAVLAVPEPNPPDGRMVAGAGVGLPAGSLTRGLTGAALPVAAGALDVVVPARD